MNSLQCGLQRGMDLFGTMLVVSFFSDIFRTMIKPKLERRLGRKLTDWDCQAYLRELDKKVEFESQQEIHKARQTRINDLKIIHDFVWKENEEKPV